MSKIREHIDRHASGKVIATRSLYQFFFSPREEDGIYARLAGNDAEAEHRSHLTHAGDSIQQNAVSG